MSGSLSCFGRCDYCVYEVGWIWRVWGKMQYEMDLLFFGLFIMA